MLPVVRLLQFNEKEQMSSGYETPSSCKPAVQTACEVCRRQRKTARRTRTDRELDLNAAIVVNGA